MSYDQQPPKGSPFKHRGRAILNMTILRWKAPDGPWSRRTGWGGGPSELAHHSIVLNASLKCNRKISTADKTWRSTHLAPSSRLPHDAPPAVVERAQNAEIPHPSSPIQGTTLFRSHINAVGATTWSRASKRKKKNRGQRPTPPLLLTRPVFLAVEGRMDAS